jgi:hypothetical protein
MVFCSSGGLYTKIRGSVLGFPGVTGKANSKMKYRHFKGGIYEIVCEALLESDPKVVMIVYKSSEGSIWTRPREVFFELVEHEGNTIRRFSPIN